jgi:hypothetical protein
VDCVANDQTDYSVFQTDSLLSENIAREKDILTWQSKNGVYLIFLMFLLFLLSVFYISSQ